jgi:hypothetical protein
MENIDPARFQAKIQKTDFELKGRVETGFT